MAAGATCRTGTPLTDAQVTPEYLETFVNQNQLTMDEAICCLPESWRRNYIIAHNSSSAQSSTTHAPRIILSPPAPRGRGGHAPRGRSLTFQIFRGTGTPPSQYTNSIEMMDLQNGQPRFSDISFTPGAAGQPGSHPARTTPNATRCLDCHSNPGRQGTFPVFPMSPAWDNTFPQLYSPTICQTQNENNTVERQRQQILEAFASQRHTALSCLPGLEESVRSARNFTARDAAAYLAPHDSELARSGPMDPKDEENYDLPSNPGRLRRIIQAFEDDLSSIYARRVADRIRAMRGYDRYRYAIAGALKGCFKFNVNTAPLWFSPAEIRQQAERIGNPAQSLGLNPVLNGQPSQQNLEAALTCNSTAQRAHQLRCFPQNCATIQKSAAAMQSTLTAGPRVAGPAGQVNRAMALMVAQGYLDLGRGVSLHDRHRDQDADAWGIVRYIAIASGSGLDTNNEMPLDSDRTGRSMTNTESILSRLVELDSTLGGDCGQLEARSRQATGRNLTPPPASGTAAHR